MEHQITSGRLPRRLRRLISRAEHAAIPVCLLLAALGLPVQAADEPLEYQVKAAFLLNFTKFIEWPAASNGGAESPFVICVIGENPFGTALDQTVAGEAVSGRKITVEYVRRPPLQQSCQIVFWTGGGKESRTLSDTGAGVLTIGEGAGFLHDGGMIAFVIDNHRVRFEINQTAAEKAGLKLSSKLLSVAKSVEK